VASGDLEGSQNNLTGGVWPQGSQVASGNTSGLGCHGWRRGFANSLGGFGWPRGVTGGHGGSLVASGGCN
jgi:hypothetical protein